MRIRMLVAISAAVAALGVVSVANAAMTSERLSSPEGLLSHLSSDVTDFFAPRYQLDGTVYGVAARSQSSIPSLQILPASGFHLRSVTPGTCSSGWCNTAAGIAASVFGWNSSYKGAGAIIGIVDTGIDLNHPEFAGRVLTGGCIVSSLNPCTNSWDQVGGDTAVFPGPNATHGTHVAGIAAGANVGLASAADILPVKVCSSTSSGCAGVTDGIVYASAHGANVINVSIGGPILSASDVAGFRTAISNGSLLVVAAGNSGNRYPTGGFLAGAALMDGVRGSMVVVGATSNGGTYGTLASFSQTPGNRCEIHGGQRYCMKDYFVVAPGVNIWSSVGDGTGTAANYGYLSGTSMATPYVTGVAAIIKGRWPTLTSSQIADIIFQTADDLGQPGSDRVFGRGAVDVTKAMSPVGAAVIATSGTLGGSSGSSASSTTTSSPSVKGASGAMSTMVSGPMVALVQNSALLKNAVVVDSFGRDFSANFSRVTYTPGFVNLDNWLSSGQFETYTPFVGAMQSPFGAIVASGFAVRTTTPRLLSGEFRTADRRQYDLRDFELSAALMPGVMLDAGYNLDMAGRFNSYDAMGSEAYDGLFFSASAVNSPYVGLTDGGSYVGTTMALADGLQFRFGSSSLDPQRPEYEVPVFSMLSQLEGPQPYLDQRKAQSTMAAVNWEFANWGGLGLTASQTDEENGLLGGINSGSLSIAKSATTSAVGLSARLGFGDGWVTTFSYNEGITQLNLRPDSIVTRADTLRSRAYGMAVAKHGLFSDGDTLGLALTRPVQVYLGNVDLTAATGVDANRNLIIGHERVSLAPGTPETDVELGYVTTFLDGALALQANAGYQMNVAGQKGTNSVTVLSRAKINF